ncbi:Thioredoxin domain-containing protein 12 [Gryllus bimaculatus]|nr:Thioredoxin domain-containing protein 12 [Gryllus bimaculatus]
MAPIPRKLILVYLVVNLLYNVRVYCDVDGDEDEEKEIKLIPSNNGRGFGSHFAWQNFDKGLEIAMLTQKPIMVIIHKSWCSACKALKPQFAASREIADLSEKFIMVNAGEREPPAKDPKFSPDGDYVPRILFLSPTGELRLEFYNEAGDPAYKYFYSDTWSILATMNKVAQTYKKRERSKKEL